MHSTGVSRQQVRFRQGEQKSAWVWTRTWAPEGLVLRQSVAPKSTSVGRPSAPAIWAGPGIGAEDGLGAVEDGDERADGELAAQVDEPPGRFERKPRAFADDDELALRHGIDQFLIIAPGPELRPPARIGMERDVGAEIVQRIGQRRAGGELEIERLDRECRGARGR